MPSEDLDSTLRQIATSYKELQAKLQRFASDDPAVVALKNQAHNALEAGDFARAEALLNDASTKDLEVAQELQETAATRLRSAAASQAANGDLNMTQLAYAEAVAYYRQAVEVLESVPTARQELAEYLNAWGLASCRAGEYSAATVPWQRALAIREQALGPERPDVATSLNNLAWLYRAQGRYGEAEPLLQRALRICEEVLGAEHPDVATSLNNLALLYDDQGRYGEAESLYQRALRIREEVLGAEHPLVATSLNNLAGLYRAQGRYGEAEPLLQRALRIREQTLGAEHPDVATVRENYAALREAMQSDVQPSMTWLQRTRAWWSAKREIR